MTLTKYYRLRGQGLCVICRQKARPGRCHCETCGERQRLSQAANRAKDGAAPVEATAWKPTAMADRILQSLR